ncbi:MAG: ParM/StbA family protein [Chitinophagaceae bacterium]
MNNATINFPSIFETAYGNTENSAKDLLNGLKIKRGEKWYLVGNLARKGAINPGRVVNAAPTEEDFDILFRSAITNVVEKVEHPFVITLGFPFSTYNVYKAAAEHYLSKRHFMLDYDTRTYNLKGSIRKNTFIVDQYEVIPEIVGGIIGLKKLIPQAEKQNFIALSFGFGTMEGALATSDGLVHRTNFSSHGIRYVISNLARELSQKYFLEMKNEYQLDEAFIKGSLFTNRKRIDLTELRKDLLTQYYKQVVSPLLRKHFTDADLESCDKIYLMGGGANYTELLEAIREEFADFIPVEVVPHPEYIVSIGYLYNSLRISDAKPSRCIGIDLGNATTAVSFFENTNNNSQPQ